MERAARVAGADEMSGGLEAEAGTKAAVPALRRKEAGLQKSGGSQWSGGGLAMGGEEEQQPAVRRIGRRHGSCAWRPQAEVMHGAWLAGR